MLDINTPLGQESLRKEEKMIEYIKKCWDVEIIITNKNKDAACDGFIVRNSEIIALFESKCRDLSYEELETYGSWLITYKKLEKCRILSQYLRVPFLGFLNLNKDNIVLFWKITGDNGKYLFDINHYESETQKTINGGKTIRDNAYLLVEHAKFVQEIENINNIK